MTKNSAKGNGNGNGNFERSFANDKETVDLLRFHQLQSRLRVTRWGLSLAVACNIVLLGVIFLMATSSHTATTNTSSVRNMVVHGVTGSAPVHVLQPLAVRRQMQDDTTNIDAGLEITDTFQSETTGQSMDDAMVTVEINGVKYSGSDEGLKGAFFHVDQDGCRIYENIRNDGKEAEVICCGKGDCLMGFLTRHQWLLSWL